MHALNPEVLLWSGVVLLALVILLAMVAVRAYLQFRGDRLITCPHNCRPAGVVVNSGHALLTTIAGRTELRLKSCSRWPERQDCGQECLSQIEAAPENCLVRHILSDWYRHQSCAVCGKPIGEIHWADHQPALLNAHDRTVDWRDVPAETIPAVLQSHRAVCWNCHVVNRMMNEHPDLVLDRSRRA